MKIIREGNIPQPCVRFECPRCACLFEAARDLEARLINDSRDGNFYECYCPQCGKRCTKAATSSGDPCG